MTYGYCNDGDPFILTCDRCYDPLDEDAVEVGCDLLCWHCAHPQPDNDPPQRSAGAWLGALVIAGPLTGCCLMEADRSWRGGRRPRAVVFAALAACVALAAPALVAYLWSLT